MPVWASALCQIKVVEVDNTSCSDLREKDFGSILFNTVVVVCMFLDNTNPNCSEVKPRCGCISLIASNPEYLFMPLGPFVFYLVKAYLLPLSPFLATLFILLCFGFLCSLCIIDNSPLAGSCFPTIFSYSVICFFSSECFLCFEQSYLGVILFL